MLSYPDDYCANKLANDVVSKDDFCRADGVFYWLALVVPIMALLTPSLIEVISRPGPAPPRSLGYISQAILTVTRSIGGPNRDF